MEEKFTMASFEAAVAKGVALVDFWAPWCGPCKMMLPVIDQIKNELGDGFKILKINVDEHQEIAQRFNVRTIPAFFVLKDGQVVESFNGVQAKDKLVSALRNA